MPPFLPVAAFPVGPMQIFTPNHLFPVSTVVALERNYTHANLTSAAKQ
jgi:hypothetical protein